MRRFSCTRGMMLVGTVMAMLDNGELSALGSAGTVSNGAFSIDVDLAEGSHKVVAKQTDVAGNVSAVSSVLDITVDETADAAPGSLDLAARDDANLQTDNITSNTTGLTISGLGVAGSSVQLYTWNDAGGNGDGNVDDELSALGSAGTVDDFGAFSIDVDLAEGSHKVVAKQTDVAGNVSAVTASGDALTITVDEAADAAPTSLDLDAADDTATDDDNITSNTSALSISGSGVSDSSVQLYTWVDANGDGNVDEGEVSALSGDVIVANGAFSVDVSLAEGTHKIVATQMDVAGNDSAASTALQITVDETANAGGSRTCCCR